MYLTSIFTLCFLHLALAYFVNEGGFTGWQEGLAGLVFGFQRICLCRCGIAQKAVLDETRSARLIGGESGTPHQYPWMAMVHVGSMTYGGSLISDRHVLTAASILYPVQSPAVTVTLGAHDRCKVGGSALNSSVSSISIHPGFSPTNLDHDLALLKLTHSVPFSKFVLPICLPLFGSKEEGQVALISSWVEEDQHHCAPKVAALPILPYHTCAKSTANHSFVTVDKGCLGPVGAKSILCKSDAGSPVMTRGPVTGALRLTGVLSSSTCDQATSPLYTRVRDYYAWINNAIRADCQCF